MEEQDYYYKYKIIKETFKDRRTIKGLTPEEDLIHDANIYNGAEVFTTEDNEFIAIDVQLNDFDEDELVKYIEFAEAMYEKHHRKISIYILCTPAINVNVKECVIKSEAEFTIKLACIEKDPSSFILAAIKGKIKKGLMPNEEDIFILEMLPLFCEKDKRSYYRKEYFKIINKLSC